MLERHGSAAWGRAHALQRYIRALETGDGAALSAALRQAQDDPILEQLIVALQDVYLDAHETAVHPDEVARAREIIQTQARASSNGHYPTGDLYADTPILPRRQEQARVRRPQEMRMGDDIPEISPSDRRQVSGGAESETHTHFAIQAQSGDSVVAARRSRAIVLLQAIAAVLVVAVMVGSFYTLFSSHLIQRGPGMDSSGHGGISLTGVTLASGEGVVLVGSRDGDVLVLRARDGALVWRYATGTGYPITALATLDGVVYANTENGDIAAVRIADGKVLWNRDFNQFEGYPDALYVEGGVLVVPLPGGVYTLRASDGASLWHSPSVWVLGIGEGAVFVGYHQVATPTSITTGATQQVGVKALRISDGMLLWDHALHRAGEDPDAVYVRQGIAYVSSFYNTSNATFGTLAALRSSDGAPLWARTENDTEAPFFASAQMVFTRTGSGICSFRADNGVKQWCIPTPDVDRAITADDRDVFVCRYEGAGSQRVLAVGMLDGGNGAQRWYWRSEPQRPITGPNNRYGVSIGSSPPNIAALDDAVYTGATAGVYAIHGSDGHQLWHTLASETVMALLAAKAG